MCDEPNASSGAEQSSLVTELTPFQRSRRIIAVKSTATISDLGRNPSAVMREAEKRGALPICKNGRTAGFLVSRDRMEAILETLEIMADPEAMKALADYTRGKVKMLPVSALDAN